MMTVWLISMLAALGGLAVFVGLWLEKKGNHDEYETIGVVRKKEQLRRAGERFVRWGVFAEMVLGFTIATWEGWKEFENNPLNQPVSIVSAILRITVDAKNYDPKKPISLDSTWMAFGSFSLVAKEARSYPHIDFPTQRVAYYGIAVRFEQSTLPNGEWNYIYNTNNYDFTTPPISVTNALSQIFPLQTYIDFVPKDREIVKGSVRIFINGFRKNFQITSNDINGDFYKWNPDKPGIFLSVTNSVP